MKPLLIIILAIGLFTEASSQAFNKGERRVNAAAGMGGYEVNVQAGEKVLTGKSAAFLMSLNYEYALLDNVGIGGQFQRNVYFNHNSGTQIKEGSGSFLFTNVLHFINTDAVDLYLGIAYGLSRYRHQGSNPEGNKIFILGTGMAYSAFTGIKLFLTERAGIMAGIAYDNFSYGIKRYEADGLTGRTRQNRHKYNANYQGINLQGGITLRISK